MGQCRVCPDLLTYFALAHFYEVPTFSLLVLIPNHFGYLRLCEKLTEVRGPLVSSPLAMRISRDLMLPDWDWNCVETLNEQMVASEV